MKKIKMTLIIFLLGLMSCGSGGGSGSTYVDTRVDPNGTVGGSISAQFIDAPVEGLWFNTEDDVVKKQTGLNGAFSCIEGSVVRFYLAKNMPIGKGVCSEKIFINQIGLDEAAGGAMEVTIAALIKIHKQNAPSYDPLLSILPLKVGGYFSPSGSTLGLTHSSVNGFLSGLQDSGGASKPVGGFASLTAFNDAVAVARGHFQNTITQNVSSSDFTSWLTNHQWLNRSLSSEMVMSPSSSTACPTDMSAVTLTIRKNGNAFYFGVKVAGQGFAETRIMDERINATFNETVPDEGSNSSTTYKGSITIKLYNGFNNAKGLIHFAMSGVSGVCEYPFDAPVNDVVPQFN